MKGRRGFSLLELAVVLAIVSVIAALALAAIQAMGGNSTPQNAANRLSGALAFARDRAADRSTDVYVIVYPARDSSATGIANGAQGAVFVYEDKLLTFRGGAPVPTRTYANFAPPNAIAGPVTEGFLHEQIWLDEFPKRTVKFGATGLAFDAPFTGIAAGDCSFCSGAGIARRGAIVFHPDGTAEFLDSAGVAVPAFGTTALSRAASLGLVSTDGNRAYLFAVGSAVSNIALQVKK